MRITPPSIDMVCNCTSLASGVVAPTSLSGLAEVLVTTMKPPPTAWPVAVSRDQGCWIDRLPVL